MIHLIKNDLNSTRNLILIPKNGPFTDIGDSSGIIYGQQARMDKYSNIKPNSIAAIRNLTSFLNDPSHKQVLENASVIIVERETMIPELITNEVMEQVGYKYVQDTEIKGKIKLTKPDYELLKKLNYVLPDIEIIEAKNIKGTEIVAEQQETKEEKLVNIAGEEILHLSEQNEETTDAETENGTDEETEIEEETEVEETVENNKVSVDEPDDDKVLGMSWADMDDPPVVQWTSEESDYSTSGLTEHFKSVGIKFDANQKDPIVYLKMLIEYSSEHRYCSYCDRMNRAMMKGSSTVKKFENKPFLDKTLGYYLSRSEEPEISLLVSGLLDNVFYDLELPFAFILRRLKKFTQLYFKDHHENVYKIPELDHKIKLSDLKILSVPPLTNEEYMELIGYSKTDIELIKSSLYT